MSQLWFLYTNEPSASGIIVLCSDQKFTHVSQENTDIKIEMVIFSKIKSKAIENKKAESWPWW